MTYKELLTILQGMTEQQLDSPITIYDDAGERSLYGGDVLLQPDNSEDSPFSSDFYKEFGFDEDRPIILTIS